ncbi:MAG: hypothetical protein COX57_07425 [Alphaproteobacteria bacterium CG_4_10_14_0_2_um_filter_63_37]|nr:MAG: hypothetical protein AUJ55_00845 [Proteobacteria bacterium CG1_02_64_396]PJA24587.1 MAG: hypothetical protein COX57_07425 [Alphaproteobacteria bacterium CG_4_10_14_0_2_um_filter_63_37]
MTTKMLVQADPEELRLAIVDTERDELLNVEIEPADHIQTKGNIYKAKVVRVEPSLQSAFVEYGGRRHGFLPFGEIHPFYYRKGVDPKKRPRIQEAIANGTELLIQTVKEERGTKGASLTTYLSLAGRYLVLTPMSDRVGVSRKAETTGQRKRMKEIIASLEIPEGMGIIVRTNGLDQPEKEIKRDLDYLLRLWRGLEKNRDETKGAALLHMESSPVIRAIREYYNEEMEEILIDDPVLYRDAKDYMKAIMPKAAKVVQRYKGNGPLFQAFGIEAKLDIIHQRTVKLPSGGSIVFDATEALTAIDINSGKSTKEHGIEETAYKTNLEAAKVIAKQLRMRDIGGLVVIDFIDMVGKEHIKNVEKALEEAMETDKARLQFGKISAFGLLEMTRQRLRPAVHEARTRACPHCRGTGTVQIPAARALAQLRAIETEARSGRYTQLTLATDADTAVYLLNEKRSEIDRIQEQYDLKFLVAVDPHRAETHGFEIDRERRSGVVNAPKERTERPAAAKDQPQTQVVPAAKAAAENPAPAAGRRGGRSAPMAAPSNEANPGGLGFFARLLQEMEIPSWGMESSTDKAQEPELFEPDIEAVVEAPLETSQVGTDIAAEIVESTAEPEAAPRKRAPRRRKPALKSSERKEEAPKENSPPQAAPKRRAPKKAPANKTGTGESQQATEQEGVSSGEGEKEPTKGARPRRRRGRRGSGSSAAAGAAETGGGAGAAEAAPAPVAPTEPQAS